MALELPTIIQRIGYVMDSSGASSGMAAVDSSITNKLGALHNKITKSISSFASSMTKYATIPVLAAAAASVDLAEKNIDAQTSIQGATGESAKQVLNLSKMFLATGGTAEYSATAILNAYAPVSGQLKAINGGVVSNAAAFAFMNKAQTLAFATGSDLADTTAAVTTALQNFQLPMKDAGTVTDELYNASVRLNIPVVSLVPAIGKLHSQIEEIVPSIGGMTTLLMDLVNHGLAGGTRGMVAAGTALTKLVSLKPGSNTFAEIKAFLPDIDKLYDKSGKFLGIRNMIATIGPELAKLPPQTRTVVEGMMLGTGRGVQAIAGMLTAGVASYDKVTADAVKKGTAAAEAAKKAATLTGQLARLKAEVEDLAVKFGFDLLPKLAELGKMLEKLITDYDHLSPGMKKFIDYGILIAAAIGPILKIGLAVDKVVKTFINMGREAYKAAQAVEKMARPQFAAAQQDKQLTAQAKANIKQQEQAEKLQARIAQIKQQGVDKVAAIQKQAAQALLDQQAKEQEQQETLAQEHADRMAEIQGQQAELFSTEQLASQDAALASGRLFNAEQLSATTEAETAQNTALEAGNIEKSATVATGQTEQNTALVAGNVKKEATVATGQTEQNTALVAGNVKKEATVATGQTEQNTAIVGSMATMTGSVVAGEAGMNTALASGEARQLATVTATDTAEEAENEAVSASFLGPIGVVAGLGMGLAALAVGWFHANAAAAAATKKMIQDIQKLEAQAKTATGVASGQTPPTGVYNPAAISADINKATALLAKTPEYVMRNVKIKEAGGLVRTEPVQEVNPVWQQLSNQIKQWIYDQNHQAGATINATNSLNATYKDSRMHPGAAGGAGTGEVTENTNAAVGSPAWQKWAADPNAQGSPAWEGNPSAVGSPAYVAAQAADKAEKAPAATSGGGGGGGKTVRVGNFVVNLTTGAITPISKLAAAPGSPSAAAEAGVVTATAARTLEAGIATLNTLHAKALAEGATAAAKHYATQEATLEKRLAAWTAHVDAWSKRYQTDMDKNTSAGGLAAGKVASEEVKASGKIITGVGKTLTTATKEATTSYASAINLERREELSDIKEGKTGAAAQLQSTVTAQQSILTSLVAQTGLHTTAIKEALRVMSEDELGIIGTTANQTNKALRAADQMTQFISTIGGYADRAGWSMEGLMTKMFGSTTGTSQSIMAGLSGSDLSTTGIAAPVNPTQLIGARNQATSINVNVHPNAIHVHGANAEDAGDSVMRGLTRFSQDIERHVRVMA